jgi:hypothetical protein
MHTPSLCKGAKNKAHPILFSPMVTVNWRLTKARTDEATFPSGIQHPDANWPKVFMPA